MKQTALITGATSGLGYEFVQLFAKDNYDLILVARNEEKLEAIKSEFPHISVTTISADLSQPGSVRAVVNDINSKGLHVNALVNNAGFGLLGKFEELNIEKQLEMIHLNISALTELTHAFLPQMIRQKSGKIMNVASTAAFQPGPLMAVYYATKAYVLSFSEALVEELKDTGVTVTTLCPGATKTNFGAVANVEKTKMFSSAMEAPTVATLGYEGMQKGKRVIITGSSNKIGATVAKFLPRSVGAKVAKYVAGEK
ncbi:SDR family NAD(P)-dependent oxidoreductase [Paenisporosarcina cavernae]|uniref:SDR family oxidoreductase n=1 Tax=Paenisporosarcina cavernae TaxID=2320858 RepID=A0A385YSK5_9BACL|nr:SDR family oxidoreductase [Paenisporosarcina cavernae]AYC28423.1 SDR family oxidoreductase [Paenisporosarcina cavernae]